MFENDNTEFTPTLTEDRSEAITARRFVCENHDAPGECTVECARLVAAMSGDDGIDWYDPTGCSYGPPRPRRAFEFDAEARACVEVTYTPVELLNDATYARLLG